MSVASTTHQVRRVQRASRPLGLWRAVQVISRTQLHVLRNTYFRGVGRTLSSVFVLACLAGLGFLSFQGARLVTGFLRSDRFAALLAQARRASPELLLPTDLTPFLEAFPSIVILMLLLMLIVGSFGSVLGALFLAPELDSLMVAPVPMRAVFITRFFSALRLPYFLVTCILLPALVGFGIGMVYGAGYYLALVPVLFAAPLIPTGLATLLVLGVVRLIPARRARDIAAALGGLFGIAVYIFSQTAGSVVRRYLTPETLASLQGLEHPLLPSTWAGRALVAAGRDAWLPLLGWGGLFIGASVLIFAGCLLLAERSYYNGWANMADRGGRVRGQGRRKTEDGGRPTADRRPPTTDHRPQTVLKTTDHRPSTVDHRPSNNRLLNAILPQQSWAIILKDLRMFPRELRNLQTLIFPIIFSGFWMYQALSRPDGSGVAFTRSSLPLLISMYICMTLSSALGGAGIGREGKAIWILTTAPISAMQLVLSKWKLALGAFLLIGPLLIIVLSLLLGAGLQAMIEDIVVLLLLAVGITSISAGAGAAFPRVDRADGRSQVSLRATLIIMVTYAFYLGTAIAMRLGPPALADIWPEYGLLFDIASWLILITVTVVVSWGALAIGAARLARAEVET